LERCVNEYRAMHPELEVTLRQPEVPLPTLPAMAQLQAVRILQEAMVNAWKHAQASRVLVEVRREGDCLLLSVEDDGRGFDLERAGREGGPHLGIAIMRERAASVQAALTVDSGLGKGTRVHLRLPL